MGFFSEFGKALHEGDGEVAKCSRCGSDDIQYQTVTESRKTGFWTIVFYIALAITLIGLLVVIPLALRRRPKLSLTPYARIAETAGRFREREGNDSSKEVVPEVRFELTRHEDIGF